MLFISPSFINPINCRALSDMRFVFYSFRTANEFKYLHYAIIIIFLTAFPFSQINNRQRYIINPQRRHFCESLVTQVET